MRRGVKLASNLPCIGINQLKNKFNIAARDKSLQTQRPPPTPLRLRLSVAAAASVGYSLEPHLGFAWGQMELDSSTSELLFFFGVFPSLSTFFSLSFPPQRLGHC